MNRPLYRLSHLFFRTLKEPPSDADVPSHQLLERGGYIKKLGKGLYCYTPLMWRVLMKVSAIVRDELNQAGCQEISMPILQPAEIWQKTGRWADFTSADLLYTLKDRENHPFCVAPTHEEVVVTLVANWITSYKQLPVNLYQIGQKFRDEIRPRFGLMRTKEFWMKDGYSFSESANAMDAQYQIMRIAYSRIFERLELDFVIVEAHGGKIGKGKSEEFQVKAAIGEDAVMVCGSYAANVEAAIAIPPSFSYEKEEKECKKVTTPQVTSIEMLSKFLKVAPAQILKTIVYKLQFADREEFVAIGIRGDRQVNDIKVSTLLGALEISLASDEEIVKKIGSFPGFIGPQSLKIPFFADHTVKPMTNFVCAINEKDVHMIDMNWQRDLPLPPLHDFLQAEEGDDCPHVPGEKYKLQRGIEVGHIFNLGTRYTETLGALFQDEKGGMSPLWMGTYGIGIGRVAQACIEQKHDQKGIVWPFAIAPYHVLVTAAAMNKLDQVRLAEELCLQLIDEGYEALLDDREERVGFKLKDSDLIGIPFKIIVGKAFDEGKKIEIESRSGDKWLLNKEELIDWAQLHLRD